MNMGWPEWLMVAWMALAIILHTSQHGKPRGTYNGLEGVIVVSAWFSLLLWGGFFD